MEKTDFKTSQVVLLAIYVRIVRKSYLLHIFSRIYFMYVFSLEVTMRWKSLLKVWLTIHVVAFACGKIRNKKSVRSEINNLSLVLQHRIQWPRRGRPRNMKYMGPPLGAIFFMTYFYRAWGAWHPRHLLWIRYWVVLIIFGDMHWNLGF